jgi:LysR family transcriptional regulator, benzoate and cis,cis-muconate-responsive activator of ben and cat genes
MGDNRTSAGENLNIEGGSRAVDMVQLMSFVKVAEERSFTKAAQRLFITKSSLSRRIRDLENELGAPLLHRGYHTNELTPAGEALLPMARELVDKFEKFYQAARESVTDSPRVFAIGFPPLLHPEALKALLEIVRKSDRSPTVKLQPYPNRELPTRLLERDIDLALIHEHVPAPRLEAVLSLQERLGVAVPKNFLGGPRVDVALDELTELTYVTSENISAPSFYSQVNRLTDQAGIIRRLELPHHEMATLMNFVVSGMAFALCPVSEQSPSNRFFRGEFVDVLPLRRAELFKTTHIGWSTDALEADPVIKQIVTDVVRTFRVPMKL